MCTYIELLTIFPVTKRNRILKGAKQKQLVLNKNSRCFSLKTRTTKTNSEDNGMTQSAKIKNCPLRLLSMAAMSLKNENLDILR